MFTHEVSLKNRLIIAGCVVAVGWTGTAIYLYRSVEKMKASNALELKIIDEARKVIMVNSRKGEYDGVNGEFDADRFLSDYEFFKIAARDKLTSD